MKSWVHFLGGSVTVYLLMAACSAGSKRAGTHGDEPRGEGGVTASNGGAQATGGDTIANGGTSAPNSSGTGGAIGGVIDDLMDPVDDADAAPATSGMRLRARYYVGDDGSKQFIGWHDKERGEDCSFYRFADGILRCAPFYAATQPAFFGDATCSSQPLSPVVKTTGAACAATTPPTKYT